MFLCCLSYQRDFKPLCLKLWLFVALIQILVYRGGGGVILFSLSLSLLSSSRIISVYSLSHLFYLSIYLSGWVTLFWPSFSLSLLVLVPSLLSLDSRSLSPVPPPPPLYPLSPLAPRVFFSFSLSLVSPDHLSLPPLSAPFPGRGAGRGPSSLSPFARAGRPLWGASPFAWGRGPSLFSLLGRALSSSSPSFPPLLSLLPPSPPLSPSRGFSPLHPSLPPSVPSLPSLPFIPHFLPLLHSHSCSPSLALSSAPPSLPPFPSLRFSFSSLPFPSFSSLSLRFFFLRVASARARRLSLPGGGVPRSLPCAGLRSLPFPLSAPSPLLPFPFSPIPPVSSTPRLSPSLALSSASTLFSSSLPSPPLSLSHPSPLLPLVPPFPSSPSSLLSPFPLPSLPPFLLPPFPSPLSSLSLHSTLSPSLALSSAPPSLPPLSPPLSPSLSLLHSDAFSFN
ncbi:hypothetical protein C7M84_020673 [Penaeus vannamei]|uniref:Uncharacterized protein n=1 Tax=Penaeus vannamei TaxID=6689 RepID=A0A3R7MGY4_PENVA|nr:hypothetical protein C7M84_020673 [Penaeus vannamei]